MKIERLKKKWHNFQYLTLDHTHGFPRLNQNFACSRKRKESFNNLTVHVKFFVITDLYRYIPKSQSFKIKEV